MEEDRMIATYAIVAVVVGTIASWAVEDVTADNLPKRGAFALAAGAFWPLAVATFALAYAPAVLRAAWVLIKPRGK
jgi:hypothetical protein